MAAVARALWVARVPEAGQASWRTFGAELGLLFQIVDDILDGDGYVVTHGVDGARRLADESADRARTALGGLDADTSLPPHLRHRVARRAPPPPTPRGRTPYGRGKRGGLVRAGEFWPLY